MNRALEERLVTAFENIANALAGIYDTQEKQFAKQWPDKKEGRDAVYTRLPTDEDLIREEQGASDASLADWLSIPDEKPIGPREKEFLEQQTAAARTQAPSESEPDSGSAEAAEGEAGTTGDGAADHPDVQER